MSLPNRLTPAVVLCGSCSCGCPEVFVDQAADAAKRILITDDFGQQIQMSADQFGDLVAKAKAGELDELLCEVLHRKPAVAASF